MGLFSNYVNSSLSDAAIPYLREPVEGVFDEVIEHKGLPTREVFRDLRNRVDMVDYHLREATKKLNELKKSLRGVAAKVEEARPLLGDK